jgi:hypothetical protein
VAERQREQRGLRVDRRLLVLGQRLEDEGKTLRRHDEGDEQHQRDEADDEPDAHFGLAP